MTKSTIVIRSLTVAALGALLFGVIRFSSKKSAVAAVPPVDAGIADAGLIPPLFLGFGDGGGIMVPKPELLCENEVGGDCFVQRCCFAGTVVPYAQGGKVFVTANDGFCQTAPKPCKTPLRFIVIPTDAGDTK